MRAALELLGDFDAPGRRIVVCGDMAELGDEPAALHWQLGKQIVEAAGADLLIACGEFARHVVGRRQAAGMPRTERSPARRRRGPALPGPGDPARRRGAGQRLADDGHGTRGRGTAAISAAEKCVREWD